MDLVDYGWMPWPSYLISCTSPKVDASMSAIGDLTIWQHVPATQTSTHVTCTLFNMKFVLASTLPTDRGWCNYLCSPCLVVGWFPFDAPSAQWPFGGALRREPVLAWCTWKGPSLRRCYAHIWHPHSLSSTLSLLVQPSTGVPKDAVSMWHLFKFCGPWGFPISSSSSRKWSPSRRCMEVPFWFVWLTVICYYWTSFKKLEAQMTHILGIRTCLTLRSLIISPPKVAKDAVLMWRLFEYCGPCFSFSFFKVTYLPLRCYCFTTSRSLSSQILGDLKEFDKDNLESSHLRWTCVNWI